MRRTTLIAGLFVLGACTGTVGAPPVSDDDGTPPGPDAPALVPGEASVARAMMWVDAKLHYCQAPNHGTDYDADCPMTCEREINADWDPYRSDCSGLVSWAWMLPSPGRTTDDFAPYKTDLTHVIASNELRAGDAVNNDHHIMLFVAWKSPTEATFIDEPGCSSATPYAKQFDAAVTFSGNTIDVTSHGSYTAIRYDAAP